MSSARRLSSPVSSSYSPPPFNSSSSTTTTSHPSLPMSDDDDSVWPPTSTNTDHNILPSPSPSSSPPLPPSSSADLLLLPPPPLPSTTTKTLSFPIREDCWSEDATRTLIEAWGSRHVDLNRGNLRQTHWRGVADAVNAVHAHTKKHHRTDVQCKNRIDTLKKKYKLEKSKVLQCNGRVVSTWPFFASLDSLIGDSFIKTNAPPSSTPPVTRKSSLAAKNTPPPPSLASRQATMTMAVGKEFSLLPFVVPVGPRSKRPAPAHVTGEEAVFRRNFSAMAAAAAAAAAASEVDEDEDESDTSSAAAIGPGSGGVMRRKKRRATVNVAAQGFRKLAEAIRGFAEIYERVEEAKQRQIVELEMQKMQFAKDMEIQRMKLFMETQVQLEKLKRSNENSQCGGEFKCSFSIACYDRIFRLLLISFLDVSMGF